MNKTLSDIAEYVTSKIECSVLTKNTYVGMDNLVPNRGGIVASEYVPQEGTTTEYKKGDVLLGNIRPYFKKIWLATNDGGCSPDVLCIRAKKGVSPLLLYAILSQDSFFDFDVKGAKGSKMPRGDKDHIMTFPIQDVDNAEDLGTFINNIQKKIINNNSICSDLEAMAKTLYDYWFVQFDFPDENGKPYKTSGGKMVWNEELKREIPEGWKSISLTRVCDVIDCLHSKKPNYCFEDEKYYLLSLDNITKEGYINLANKFYISKNDYEYWTQKVTAQENDFVVTNAGRAGDIGKMPSNVKCAIGRNITLIRPCKIDAYYLRQFFKSNYLTEQILNNLDSGSFFMSFNVYAIKKLCILYPNAVIYRTFIDKVKPIIIKIEELQEENRELTSLRDFLLPMLMNGQVKIKESE